MSGPAGWAWADASRRGIAHARAGEPRQDARRVGLAADGAWLVAVACDGAGSAPRGGAAAVIAARMLRSCAFAHFAGCRSAPDAEQVAAWFGLVRAVIARSAADRGLPVSQFATTAVVALSDGTVVVTAHVGDGAVLARLSGPDTEAGSDEVNPSVGAWTVLSWPEHGEYVSETFFVTDADLRLRVSCHEVRADRLVVMTDGLERLAIDFELGAAHAPFLDGMCRPLVQAEHGGRDVVLSNQLARYLGSPAMDARTDDDRTLILAAFR